MKKDILTVIFAFLVMATLIFFVFTKLKRTTNEPTYTPPKEQYEYKKTEQLPTEKEQKEARDRLDKSNQERLEHEKYLYENYDARKKEFPDTEKRIEEMNPKEYYEYKTGKKDWGK